MLAAPRGFEPRFTDPKSAVLPLDEGAAVQERRNGAEDGTRTRDPHLGKVMLYELSYFRLECPIPKDVGAESQIRTGDTAIFSRVLYQLSYLGPMANQPSAARRRVERYHGPPETSNRSRAAMGQADALAVAWQATIRVGGGAKVRTSPHPAPFVVSQATKRV